MNKATLSLFDRDQIDNASDNPMVRLLMRTIQLQEAYNLHKNKNIEQLKVSAIVTMLDNKLTHIHTF